MNESIDIRNISKQKQSQVPDKKIKSANETSGFWTILNKDIKIFGSDLPDKVKESFYLELSTLLAAGVDIRASLELITNEQPQKKYRPIFANLLQQVITGSTLSATMKASDLFTTYEYFSVQIGEETGKITIVLTELANYYKKKINQKRQIIGALTYPVLVMSVAIGAVSFMMAYVVPMFADILKRFGGELPFITRLVLSISNYVKTFGPIIFLATMIFITFIITQRKKTWFRELSSKTLIRIPLIGDIIRKIYLARFANTMELLIGSKIPMLQSIQLVKQMVGFYPIEKSLSEVEENVLSGISLNKSLGFHSIYPKKMISLIKVGEEVNQLDLFFKKISEQYSDEIEYQTTLLSKFMEPLIIVVLGGIVGTILIAMYLPLFKLGQTF
ncbi:MAG TPA: type II secretion system F family protein [Ferruginibacter sp.]|jgi:type IV pilus assembly protein PilC|nr:type II secretion system F family protein [Ferruginibacter sp.]